MNILTNPRKLLALVVILLAFHAVILWQMGQPLICECNYIKIWEGVVLSEGNSQHLTDWYTPSHVIHGFLFYLLTWILFPNMPLGMRLLIAIGLESGWEISENTDFVINKYRETALAQGYSGDSVLNSVMDLLAMIGGFFFAWRWPAKVTVAIGLIMEIFTAYVIRDNLFLNILNFIYQFDFIVRWQLGG